MHCEVEASAARAVLGEAGARCGVAEDHESLALAEPPPSAALCRGSRRLGCWLLCGVMSSLRLITRCLSRRSAWLTCWSSAATARR
eukprot:scaffold226916_cov35-Tisochrysis_lutea.AAC.1